MCKRLLTNDAMLHKGQSSFMRQLRLVTREIPATRETPATLSDVRPPG